MRGDKPVHEVWVFDEIKELNKPNKPNKLNELK
jgi:hypothetical protein